MGSERTEKDPSKVLEMLKSPWIKWVSITWPRCVAKVYIKRGNPKFGGSHHKPQTFLPLSLHLQGGGIIYSILKVQEIRGPRTASHRESSTHPYHQRRLFSSHGRLSPFGRHLSITIYIKSPSRPTVISWQT
jgi:hypothetical protein